MGWIKSKVKSTPRGSKKGSAAKEAEAAAAQKEKEEAAALKVQSLSRGNSGRKVSQTKKEEKQTKEEQDAVTKMQAAARGGQRGGCPQPSRARRSCRLRRRMTSSSTQVQSQTRMAGLWLRQNVAKPVENFFMSMPCLGQR